MLDEMLTYAIFAIVMVAAVAAGTGWRAIDASAKEDDGRATRSSGL